MITVKNIETVYYDRLYVLRGVSLEVGEGEVRVILGPNGAGKTTLLRTIMGMIRNQPRKGEIFFDGRKINGLDTEKITSLGVVYVPEDRGIFPELSVWENLMLGFWRRKVSKKALKDDLDEVFEIFPILAERKKQIANTLSGGEQQMLSIARALLKKPRLLLLDEPSLGLSPKLTAELYRCLRRINEHGTSMLVAEQNPKAAATIAHYGYVLEGGKFVLEGEISQILEHSLVKELYLGVEEKKSVKGWRLYRTRRRW